MVREIDGRAFRPREPSRYHKKEEKMSEDLMFQPEEAITLLMSKRKKEQWECEAIADLIKGMTFILECKKEEIVRLGDKK